MSENYTQLLRAGYEAFNSGDFDAAVELLHPDFDWNPGERSLSPGGVEGVGPFRDLLEPDVFESQQIAIDEITVEGDRAIVVGRLSVRGRGSGIEIESPLLHVWQFKDGRGVSCSAHHSIEVARAAFESA